MIIQRSNEDDGGNAMQYEKATTDGANEKRLVEETEALNEGTPLSVRIPSTRQTSRARTMSSSDSSFSSSFSSSLGASAAAAPPAAVAAAAAGPAPPAPTLERSSLTSLPSRALARRDAQMGSSSTLAAFVSARIFSDCSARTGSVR